MSRERKPVTVVVDGVEVQAPEGVMLVDAAKSGDVEIPVFCYEPKLGGPVGACRMCLVEIEGIPKLQTSCSTPIRDGMVVYTQTDRVKEAQSAVVEFLLVNHPLDCPVCDKGGECPLQDIAMGWGAGRSRVTDPKRHFQKPVPLSPLVRIDRERCILCYRCVRFSQEVAEDEQLQLLERGANTFVGTFDDRPYIAPFHGNVIELCPVGALTSEAYRFHARPWDIEDAGSICTLCPSQCNVKHTVRDDEVRRVLARDNHDVDDGWLCDKGRFGFQMVSSAERITQPLVKGEPARWDEALKAAAEGLRAAGSAGAAIIGGAATNEEGYLVQRILRRALGSPHVDSAGGIAADRAGLIALSDPGLAGSVADLDSAESILVLGCDPMHAMPIIDLRIRKAIRNGARLAVATDRPTALDGGADEVARYNPGNDFGLLYSLHRELAGQEHTPGEMGDDVGRIAGALRPGSTVIVFGERIGRSGSAGLQELLACARAIDAKILGVPETANARGLREVGCVPSAGPGFSEVTAGRGHEEILTGLADRELGAVLLFEVDPVRDLSGGPAWDEALTHARFVVAVSAFPNSSTAHADVVLPAEMYPEKEGTVTHPDGRLQRLRPSVPAPGAVRPGWQVLAELSALLGDETGIDSAPDALAAIAEAVPFYAGLTHEEIGGRGVRWQERDAAKAAVAAGSSVDLDPASAEGQAVAPRSPDEPPTPAAVPGGESFIALGTYRDLWAAEATQRSPALRFLAPAQTLEVSTDYARERGIEPGDEVDVRSNGTSVRARVAVRDRIRPGSGFLIEGLGDDAAPLSGRTVEVTKVGGE